MLKKWIDKIRNQPNLYKSEAWKYHISGNVIEISILPVFLKDRKSYRCSVIAIGQVLKSLSCRIEKRESNFHIQSFPSLENPGLVATLRMDEHSSFSRSTNHKRLTSLKECTPAVTISTLAKQHQLEIQELTEPIEFQSEDLNFDDYHSWFALYSSFNNPFIWLNIGYLKESIQHDCHNLLGIQESTFVDCCSTLEDEKPILQAPENKYFQSIIGVNPKAVKNV